MTPTVLSIEDDQTYAEILQKNLERVGFHVLRSSHGEEGLKRAIQDQPDVIMLDIGLPKKDGFEVLEELKSDPKTKHIPVFMLTKLSAREDVARCFDAGCEDYFIKTQHHPEDIVRNIQQRFFKE